MNAKLKPHWSDSTLQTARDAGRLPSRTTVEAINEEQTTTPQWASTYIKYGAILNVALLLLAVS